MTSVPLVTTATVHSPRPRIVLDPRTVLVHILLIGTVTFSLHTLAATAVFVLLTAAFIAVVASPRGGAAMVVLWVVFAGLRASIGLWAAATPLSLLIPTLTVFVRIGPLMGAGLLFTRALSVSRFVAALERLRVPRAVTVTLAGDPEFRRVIEVSGTPDLEVLWSGDPRHDVLHLEVSKGVEAYAFTFG